MYVEISQLGGALGNASTLEALDFRWPTVVVIDAFRATVTELAEMAGRAPLSNEWIKVLSRHLDGRLRRRLFGPAGTDLDQVKWVLREESALNAMLLHMELPGRWSKKLHNGRRTRTEYPTYPTSPMVGRAIAEYVCEMVADDSKVARPIRILDPSMEGGPLLLEVAFEAAARAERCSNFRRWRSLILTGIDQNPASRVLADTIFNTWNSYSPEPSMQLDLRCQDAFDALGSLGALHAVVNNPPWGASTDGADGGRLRQFGPYVGYRDPYIAFVSSSLRKLESSAPFGLVLPLQVLTAPSAAQLRQELLENCHLDQVVVLPRTAFPRATIRTVMLLGRRRNIGERQTPMIVVHYPMSRRMRDRCEPVSAILDGESVASLGAAAWLPVVRSGLPFRPTSRIRPLSDVATVHLGIEPYRIGQGRPKQTSRHLRERPFTFARAAKGTTPVIRSRELLRFALRPSVEHVRVGPWLANPRDHLGIADKPRVFVRQICGRDGSLVAAVAPRGVIARYGVFTILCERIEPVVLCALLNSRAAAHFVRWNCAGFHKESFGRITAPDLRNFPIPDELTGRGPIARSLKVEAGRATKEAQSRLSSTPMDIPTKIDDLVDLAFGLRTDECATVSCRREA